MRYAIILLCLCVLVSCGYTVIARGVMNGYDSASGTTIDPINVWDNYQTRAHVVMRLHHGKAVEILEQTADAYHIRAGNVDGWVGRDFVTLTP